MYKNLIFKIVTIANLCVSAVLGLFLIISLILAGASVLFLDALQFIAFIILIVINVCYIVYNLTILIINKERTN